MTKKRGRLGAFLKEKRIKRNLSQSEVAQLLKYSTPQFISNWERGVSSPPLDKINTLIDLYGLSRREIIEVILDETRDHLESQIISVKNSRKFS